MRYFILLLIFSCQSTKLSKSMRAEQEKICLNIDGHARIIINNSKYLLEVETLLNHQEEMWVMQLTSSLYGQEVLEFPLSDKQSSPFWKLEDKIIANQNDIDVQMVANFFHYYHLFILDMSRMRLSNEASKHYLWELGEKKLIATLNKDRRVIASFYQPLKKHFYRMDFQYNDDARSQNYRLEFIVRQCLDEMSSTPVKLILE